jgi:hypothetical protein
MDGRPTLADADFDVAVATERPVLIDFWAWLRTVPGHGPDPRGDRTRPGRPS